jgi:hypothetical protein
MNILDFNYDQIQDYYNSCKKCTFYNDRIDTIYDRYYKTAIPDKDDFKKIFTKFMIELKSSYEFSPSPGFLEDSTITNFNEWLKHNLTTSLKIRSLFNKKQKDTLKSRRASKKQVKRSRKTTRRASKKQVKRSRKTTRRASKKQVKKSRNKSRSSKKKVKKSRRKHIDSSLSLPMFTVQVDPNNLTFGNFYYIKHYMNDPENSYSYYGKYINSRPTYAVFDIYEEGTQTFLERKNIRYTLYNFFENE